MTQKDFFAQFLSEHFSDNRNVLLEQFERYHSWLVATNQKLNVISRQTDEADIWTVHFLDSLLPVKYVDFSGCRILDFGTGGGLPGIPLAIAHGGAEVTLLDSRKKKIAAVKDAAACLGLGNCRFSDDRIEDFAGGAFDIIVSRSVKIEPMYKPVLLKLLKPKGRLVLYKSRNLEDVQQFAGARIFDVSAGGEIGERRIVVVEN